LTIAIYHNPRCSKSRQTLELLRNHGFEPAIIEYLKTPPSVDELKAVIMALGISPHELLRKGEAIYKELGLHDGKPSDETLIQAMVTHPVLIERPIVIRGEKAAIGRPPENVLTLL
jgi:arsenate reductase